MLRQTETVVIATRNQGKVREFAQWFKPLQIEVRSLSDFTDLPDIVEDGRTFAENAEKKARIIAERLDVPVLADDSGLCVDALNGLPGVRSARYAGEKATDEQNNRKLLEELRRVTNHESANHESTQRFLSPARFVCALALVDPANGQTIRAEGSCEGYIIGQPRGSNGFGYDPLFYLPRFERTMAELTTEEKNEVSHRGKALRRLFQLLQSRKK